MHHRPLAYLGGSGKGIAWGAQLCGQPASSVSSYRFVGADLVWLARPFLIANAGRGTSQAIRLHLIPLVCGGMRTQLALWRMLWQAHVKWLDGDTTVLVGRDTSAVVCDLLSGELALQLGRQT